MVTTHSSFISLKKENKYRRTTGPFSNSQLSSLNIVLSKTGISAFLNTTRSSNTLYSSYGIWF